VSTREFLIDSPRRDNSAHRRGAPVDPEEAARQRALEHARLQRMVDYAETRACLRATILRYFGDPEVREPCGSCGNCHPGWIVVHERELVRKILSGIARAGERFGRYRIISMLLGDSGDLPPALTSLSTCGLLAHETAEALHAWVDACVAAGLVAVTKDQYRTLSLTPAGREVMRGRRPDVRIARPNLALLTAGALRTALRVDQDEDEDDDFALPRRKRVNSTRPQRRKSQ
jgi:ATP-dependent DNA helicase RecQ